MTAGLAILQPAPADLPALLPDLAAILLAAVEDGASVGFVLPFAQSEALAFWQGMAPAIAAGDRLLLVAHLDGRPVGTVQLVLAMPPNGRHRAEIAKLLVHPAARRRGIARALMLAAEAEARRHCRTLLVLDTRTGDGAEALYAGLGYALAGSVPDYAQATDGRLAATSFMYKVLVE
ncbi:ribosomal protein S18 acetylase RimI-like enzyme [Stella humosa]|uniref:Ribosomal protein S18 acetylase RimI-like enzyme n=1 Tax=Stella humosa TaxID=94 RepID=A0A3N1M8X6_9PROT|nr:GNAT family N-acetyltransferase [Stella humosa]ROQ00118.1 ribosomal protein S18 acetylase RimI-like enzyme [Stella humosa]BBK30648.1 N-acetyltransferase [Stella humosa]